MRIQLNAHGLPIPSLLKCTSAVAAGGCLPPSALPPGVFHGFMACALPHWCCCWAGLPAPPCTHPGCFSWFYGWRPPSLVLLLGGAACPALHPPRVFFMVLGLAPSLVPVFMSFWCRWVGILMLPGRCAPDGGLVCCWSVLMAFGHEKREASASPLSVVRAFALTSASHAS